MNSAKTIFQEFTKRITIDETNEEITSIGYLVFEHVLDLSKTDIMTLSSLTLSPEKSDALSKVLRRINDNEPVQYIFGKADFFGFTFKVDSSVLIPRPETEELVRLALDLLSPDKVYRVLDIGTGSGCIPISIKLARPAAEVFATDVSPAALSVAQQNAQRLHADIIFLQHDILHNEIPIHNLDVIISNPPYITTGEKNSMSKNVLDHEPNMALFVPGNDALIFYRAIGDKAKKALATNALLLVEINEQFGAEVKRLFETQGFQNAKIHKDLSGKDRFVSCYANPAH